MSFILDFEKPLDELNQKIIDLRRLSSEGDVNLSNEISQIEKRAEKLKLEVFSNLTPKQILQIARHPNRPDSLGLSKLIFDDFIELHGDRQFRDDPAIICGVASLDGFRVVVVGHQKGHDTKEKVHRNFGMPHPEGYRKALRFMKMAEKFSMPIVTFVDTPGAYPGKEAEERGQAEAIARNLTEMTGIQSPIITVVIGEGGSGGALGIAMANRVYMLEYSVYSVISPEGCASILFRDSNKADYAAEKLKITSQDILDLGVAHAILPEPLGGAHNNWASLADTIRTQLRTDFRHYQTMSSDDIQAERYDKYRSFGEFQIQSSSTKRGAVQKSP